MISTKSLMILMTILLWVIFGLHLGALHFAWYWTYWWFDIPMHFLGGAWLGGMAILALRKWAPEKTEKKVIVYTTAIVVALFIGGVWELFEFSLDTFVIMRVNDIADTITDFGMDVAGALSAALLIMGKSKN
ncbi:MAG: hypothetical protein H8D63_02350 [Parcubacteria group bacterium]|nr:hypothetical protein [Parcubacteria group bacterium]